MSGENSSSPPLHAAMSGSYQPKRPTLSRFFKRYPYGERRSRAVAPADASSTTTPRHSAMASRRRKGYATFSRSASVSHMPVTQRARLHLGEFMRQLYVELFFVIIVLFYGTFVVAQLTMTEEDLKSYKSAIDVTDITVGSILLLEIILKIVAYGMEYLRNGWSLFDAIVIVVSFVLGIVAATEPTSTWLVKILRMRVILRILRVLVVFERLKQRSRAMKLTHKHALASPVEHVLRLLSELRFHPALGQALRTDLEFAIDAIKNNRLYDANEDLLNAEGVDDDTQQWLRGELKVNEGAKSLGGEESDDRTATFDRVSGNNANVVNNDDLSNPTQDQQSSLTHIKQTADAKVLLTPLDPIAERELHALFEHVTQWVFDIFRVDIITHGNALTHLGYHLLHDLTATTLQIEPQTLVSFLLEIQRGYVATNPYHSAIHAADVMQTTFYFMRQPELTPFFRPLDHILAMVAAAIHDFKHDGFNNSFHISTASDIALRYNDHAVLENYHVAQSFLVIKNADLNIFARLPVDDFKYSREMIIQMVLATDMAKHFEDVALFKANILPGPDEEFVIKSVADKKLVLKMILHTSDVSNPAKDREIMLRWTDRVVEEFCLQGDMEKQLGLAVSPFMDRETIVLKKMQVGFADFIVAPLFSTWAQVLPQVEAVAYKTLLGNREFWFGLTEEFKPHMIRDVVRELAGRKRVASMDDIKSQSMPSIEDRSGLPNTGRVRRSVVGFLTPTDDITK